MKQKVEAGLLADVKKTLQKLSDAFFKFIDSFADNGIEVKKTKETKDGGQELDCLHTESGIKFTVTTTPPDEKTGLVDAVVHFKNIKHKDMVFKDMKENEAEANAKQLVEELSESLVSAATKLYAQMKRSGDGIELTAIKASTDIATANGVIQLLADNPEFVNSLTDEVQDFTIIDTGEGYDVCKSDTSDVYGKAIYDIFWHAIVLWSNLNFMLDNACGEDVWIIRDRVQSFTWYAQDCINQVTGMCLEANMYVPNRGDIPEEHRCRLLRDMPSDCSIQSVLGLVQTYIQLLLDTIEFYYINFSHDTQYLLDQIVANWKRDITQNITQYVGEVACR